MSGVAITSPARSVYPELDFTKRDLAQFYSQIADWMLPYVANRPRTLVRCERGFRSADDLRKGCRFLPHEPGWYPWAELPIRRVHLQEQKSLGEYLVVDSAEGLVALVQGDIIEIHLWNSSADRPEHPDRIVLIHPAGAGRHKLDGAMVPLFPTCFMANGAAIADASCGSERRR